MGPIIILELIFGAFTVASFTYYLRMHDENIKADNALYNYGEFIDGFFFNHGRQI